MLGKNKKNLFTPLALYTGEAALIVSAIFGLMAFLALMWCPKVGWLAGLATLVTIATLIVAVVFLTIDFKPEKLDSSDLNQEKDYTSPPCQKPQSLH